jgi:ketopantoate reductase
MAAAKAKNRPTEIDWINGAVAQKAAFHGIAVPETERIIAAMKKA